MDSDDHNRWFIQSDRHRIGHPFRPSRPDSRIPTGSFRDNEHAILDNSVVSNRIFGSEASPYLRSSAGPVRKRSLQLIHEGLYDVGHPKGARSYGAQWGGQSSTYHHNLLANNVSRSPRFNGARSNDDKVDQRIVNEVSTGTSTGKGNFNGGAVSGIIDNPSVVGGYPTYKTYNTVKDDDHDGMDDAWEKSNGLDPANASDGNTIGSKNGGYTNLEVYLNGLAGEFTPGFNYQGTNSVNQNNSRLPESVSRVEAHLDGKRGTLWLSSADKVRSVAIFDVAGSASIVRTGTDIRNLDIGTLANGLYIARVATTGSKSQSIKFIK